MLRKILALSVAVSAATLIMSTNALAWGGGSWNRSGSASYTGRYGNTYSRNYSSSGSFAGGGYHGGGYYGGGYHYGAVEGITAGDFMQVMSPVRMARLTLEASIAVRSGESPTDFCGQQRIVARTTQAA